MGEVSGEMNNAACLMSFLSLGGGGASEPGRTRVGMGEGSQQTVLCI